MCEWTPTPYTEGKRADLKGLHTSVHLGSSTGASDMHASALVFVIISRQGLLCPLLASPLLEERMILNFPSSFLCPKARPSLSVYLLNFTNVLSTCMFGHCIHAWGPQKSEERSDTLVLELQLVVSHHMEAPILYKSNKSS